MSTSKILIFCYLILLYAGGAMAQKEVYAINNTATNILYRGYPNKLIVDLGEQCSNCKLVPVNISITEIEGFYTHIAKPTGWERTASLLFVDSLVQDTLKKIDFAVYNLPVPEIYWGASVSGKDAPINSSLVRCAYNPSVPLNVQFQIKSINISIEGLDQDFVCHGSNLSEDILKTIRSVSKGSSICLICTVVGIDGIWRKKAGCYKR